MAESAVEQFIASDLGTDLQEPVPPEIVLLLDRLHVESFRSLSVLSTLFHTGFFLLISFLFLIVLGSSSSRNILLRLGIIPDVLQFSQSTSSTFLLVCLLISSVSYCPSFLSLSSLMML